MAIVLVAAVSACGGPSTADRRADQRALGRVLAADAVAADRLDPLVMALGEETPFAAGAARTRRVAEAREAALRAERRARALSPKTTEGRALADDLRDLMSERCALVDAVAAAGDSGDARAALEAIRSARALEERLQALDARVQALAGDGAD